MLKSDKKNFLLEISSVFGLANLGLVSDVEAVWLRLLHHVQIGCPRSKLQGSDVRSEAYLGFVYFVEPSLVVAHLKVSLIDPRTGLVLIASLWLNHWLCDSTLRYGVDLYLFCWLSNFELLVLGLLACGRTGLVAHLTSEANNVRLEVPYLS